MSSVLQMISRREGEPRPLARRACAVIAVLAATWSLAAFVDTAADPFLAAPVAITLVATSTFDSAQVATINVLITN